MERISSPAERRFSTLPIAEGPLHKARRLWKELETASLLSHPSPSSCFILVTLSDFCEVW